MRARSDEAESNTGEDTILSGVGNHNMVNVQQLQKYGGFYRKGDESILSIREE